MSDADYYEVIDSLAVLSWIARQPDLGDYYAQKITESVDRIQSSLPAEPLASAQALWHQEATKTVR